MRATLQRRFIPHSVLLVGTNKRYSCKATGSIRTSDLHHDLESFLKYAKGIALPTHTTVYVGTLYEYVPDLGFGINSIQKFFSRMYSGIGPDNWVD